MLSKNGETVMSIIEMRAIPKPKEGTRTIFTTKNNKDDFVFIVGNGNNDYVCSICKKVICKNVDSGQVSNIVFQCPKCENYIEVKGKIKYN